MIVVSSTTITAVTPAHAAGSVSITITTPSRASTLQNAFSYASSSILSVFPNTGVVGGGALITISGNYLGGATSVTIGGAPATNLVVVSPTTITAVTPTGTLGPADVIVTTPAGTLTSLNGFTYVSWATVLEWEPNAAVVTNTTMRNAITASGLPWKVLDNGTNIEMLLVPAGTFTMGCSASTQFSCEPGGYESPTHQVTLTQAFYMGRYEVTQTQWTAKMGSNPSLFSGYSDSPSRPVERVSWNMIASGSSSFMSITGLRLPTEAEWEYAYRAETTTAFHSYPAQPNGFNDDLLVGNIAWYLGNNGESGSTYGTKAVGGKRANGLGLFDMAGNVSEWCQDWLGQYSSASVTNPTGPTTGSFRMLRGGDWVSNSTDCRASNRGDTITPDFIYKSIGFRVARNP